MKFEQKEVENITERALDGTGYTLYSIETSNDFGFDILRICIDKQGGVDIEELSNMNRIIGDKLDEEDVVDGEYMLEVSSPGAEKELRTFEDIKDSIDKYIYVESDAIYEGFLLGIENNTLEVECNFKGRIKNVKIEYEDIKFIRLAVKNGYLSYSRLH